jgi:sigma-B regulation protein RsbU (phosphoserine phosphatase)
MDKTLFRSEAECSLHSVRRMRSILSTVCRSTGASPEMESRLITCFSEAATNVVEHTRPRASRLRIEISQTSEEWRLDIIDDGGRPHPPDKLQDIDFDPENEHGRGIMIIQALADEYSEEPVADGRFRSRIRMRREDAEQADCVIIVEDNPALLSLYTLYLENHYRVIGTTDPNEALQILMLEPTVQAVISDIQMPEMDGIEFRQLLLGNEGTELVPFIFLTGESDESIVDQARQMFIDAFLTKPVSASSLLSALNNAILRKKQLTRRINNRILRQLGNALPSQIEPSSQHWRIGHGSRTTGLGGGDFVIEQCVGDDRYIVIADVMGHDEAAKFFAFAYSGFLRGLFASMQEPVAPHVIMQQLSRAAGRNELLCSCLLTCCILRLKPGARIDYCTAAHPPLLLLSNSQITRLDSGGSLPGLVDDEFLQTDSVSLAPGQRLFAITDGLLEGADTQAQRDRLEHEVLQSLAASQALGLKTAVDTILARFDAFSSRPFKDDVTLLAIEPVFSADTE